MGTLVVKDARGRELYRGLPAAAANRVSLTVPGSALEGAAYPVAIDPVISPEYPVSDPVPAGPAGGNQTAPSVAFDGTNYLVAWQDARSGTTADIYGARVNQAGAVLDAAGIPISTAANNQTVPSVAFGGTNYLVAWEDYRSGNSDIYGARVSQAGAVLDPAGIGISTAANYQTVPSVAFDGTNYLVAWQDTRSGVGNPDIYGARVSQAGVVLDLAGIAISTAAYYESAPSVAFDGTNYLVAWEDGRSGTNYDIYGARVSQAGAVLDPAGIAISTAASNQTVSSVTFGGTNYLVAWADLRVDGSTFDIYGARVNQAGVVLDLAGIAISTAANSQAAPSVAFDGTNYLVAWQDARSGTTADIYGARVNQAGTVLDSAGIPISTAPNTQAAPSVAFDGTNYLVVWQDDRSGTTNYDIYGARVSQAGAVLDPAGTLISTTANYQLASKRRLRRHELPRRLAGPPLRHNQ